MSLQKNKAIKIGSLQLSWSGFVFLTIFNVSLALIIANLFLWKTGFWCHYSIFCLIYFAVFFKAISSKDVKKFFSIIRTGLFFVHILIALVFLINFWVKSGEARAEAWTYVVFLFKWFFPISLISICAITIIAFTFRLIRISRMFIMLLVFLPQCIVSFNIALSPLIGCNGASYALNLIMLISYLSIITIIFISYIARFIYHLIKTN
ncbi:MAG: hypothetical protein IJW54_02270 [Clostridia bacterium]|nr:hypothetical protein [Clostridia bacterium]